MAFQGLDDLHDGSLLFGFGVPFRLGKEGAGLLEQVLEPAVAQGILPDGVGKRRSAVSSVGVLFHLKGQDPELALVRMV